MGENGRFSIKNGESNKQGFKCKFLAVLAVRNAKDSISCMGQAHTSDALTVRVDTRDEARARLKSIPLTARRITIPQMRSLKWKES